MYKFFLYMYNKKNSKNLYIESHENPSIQNQRSESAHV